MLRKLSCNYGAASLSKHGIESLLFLPPCCLKTPVRRVQALILIVAHRAPAHVSRTAATPAAETSDISDQTMLNDSRRCKTLCRG
jgi:hypothetical protein